MHWASNSPTASCLVRLYWIRHCKVPQRVSHPTRCFTHRTNSDAAMMIARATRLSAQTTWNCAGRDRPCSVALTTIARHLREHWSLRLNSNFQVARTKKEKLKIQTQTCKSSSQHLPHKFMVDRNDSIPIQNKEHLFRSYNPLRKPRTSLQFTIASSSFGKRNFTPSLSLWKSCSNRSSLFVGTRSTTTTNNLLVSFLILILFGSSSRFCRCYHYNYEPWDYVWQWPRPWSVDAQQ
jgi:hypothetical protein